MNYYIQQHLPTKDKARVFLRKQHAQEYVGKTLEAAGKGVDVTVGNLSQVVLPDRGAMTPPNTGTPTPARNMDHDVPTAPGTDGMSCHAHPSLNPQRKDFSQVCHDANSCVHDDADMALRQTNFARKQVS